MAKRMTKAESTLIMWLIIIGLPIFLIFQLGESMGWGTLVIIGLVAVTLVVLIKAQSKKKRREALLHKYQDPETVAAIMTRSFWQGQTDEQLVDSLGNPEDIDQKILKTKKKEIWKYNHQGGNRYGLRITLENDHVVGWDQKT